MTDWTTGDLAGLGALRCAACEHMVSVDPAGELPACPNCGGTEFVRPSLQTTFTSTADHVQPAPEAAEWLEELREHLSAPGEYIAFRDGEQNATAFVLRREWTRIGRSLAADIRFDDPTVSRRHALIVRQPDGLRVLDDRSLNGVFVNGDRVEWSPLSDGDVIAVGRHQLHFFVVQAVSGMRDIDVADAPGAGAQTAGSR